MVSLCHTSERRKGGYVSATFIDEDSVLLVPYYGHPLGGPLADYQFLYTWTTEMGRNKISKSRLLVPARYLNLIGIHEGDLVKMQLVTDANTGRHGMLLRKYYTEEGETVDTEARSIRNVCLCYNCKFRVGDEREGWRCVKFGHDIDVDVDFCSRGEKELHVRAIPVPKGSAVEMDERAKRIDAEAAEPKLAMTRDEIRINYNEASNKRQQITILAQLNDTTENVIRSLLGLPLSGIYPKELPYEMESNGEGIWWERNEED